MPRGLRLREFCIGVRRKVHLAYGGALQNVVPAACNGCAIGGEVQFELGVFQFFDVVRESRVERGFAQHVEVHVLRPDLLGAFNALFKESRGHESAAFRSGGDSAGAKTAMQVTYVCNFDIDAVHCRCYFPSVFFNARMALPRWLMSFFSSSSIWAKVRVSPSGTNNGS